VSPDLVDSLTDFLTCRNDGITNDTRLTFRRSIVELTRILDAPDDQSEGGVENGEAKLPEE